jgi:outer membrane protein TolC
MHKQLSIQEQMTPPLAADKAPMQQATAEPAQPGTGVGVPAHATEPVAPPTRSKAHYLWAMLIACIYEVFPLLCPLCGEGSTDGRYLASCGWNAYPWPIMKALLNPPMNMPFALRSTLAAALSCWALVALAQTPVTDSLSYDVAWSLVKANSDKLAAAQAAVDNKTLQRQGLSGLGGPSVAVSGAAYHYSASLDVSLDPINRGLAQTTQRLPPPLQDLPIPANPFPSNYTYKKEDSNTTASLSATWPLYMGGASDAVRGLVDAQAQEAQADALRTRDELATLLAQRYFGAQLATKAARLRQAAFANVEKHDQSAERMLSAGVIARVDRLQVRAALEEARRNAQKAQDDAELATIALARTLRAQGPVPQAATLLFLNSQPLPSLEGFIDAALRQHPGLAKVAAKKAQAERLHDGEDALRKPQVFAFGQHQLKEKNADWVAGVGVRWSLWDTMDRKSLSAATQQLVVQAERSDAQARSDIALLVERNWRLVDQARRQYLAQQPSVDVAQEVLRLRTAALAQGTGTTLELLDAETNYAKVHTERAQTAYDYTVALAQLLESCGLSEEMGAYVARADIRVE